jgi:hypothetical protein
VANQVANIALGRVVELYNRVKNNDPAASTFVIAILATAGLESDATLKDKDTFADVVSGTTNEVTNSGYARKVLTDADLLAWAPTDASDVWDLDLPDQTWTAVAAGDGWSRFVVNYDPSSTGVTSSVMVPLTFHDFVVTPDGSDITAQIAAAGFFRAS